jgi:hypothetical protein
LISLEIDIDGKEIPRNKTGDVDKSAMARSIDISKDEEYIALGMMDGTLRVYNKINQASGWKLIACTLC